MTVSTTTIALRTRRTDRRGVTAWLRSPTAILSLIWLVGLMIASLTGPLWLRYDPLAQDLTAVLQGPSAAHLLGTDELGRDLASRITTAAAPTLFIALLTPIVAVIVTTPIVLWASRSRRAEAVMGRVAEIVLSLPGMVILLAVIAAVGTNMPIVMAIFGLLLFGAVYRVFIGQAVSLNRQLYVEAATVDGMRPMLASLRHVLPNMSTTVIVQFVLLFGVGIGMQAGLAFIGLGPQPPEPTWGGMIQAASKFIFQQPWMMVPTGAVLALTIISANALADVVAGGASMPPSLVSIRTKRSRKSGSESPVAASAATTPAMTISAPDGTLRVEDLVIGVSDGGIELVKGVTWSVAPGRVMGLVGESGCGKTVTSHAILGLLTPGLEVRSGRILWGDTDLASADGRAYARVRGHEIAFISQEPTRALDPMFTVGWQLAVTVKRLRKVSNAEAKKIAVGLLADVGILDPARVMKSYPHEISGGMAQRVAIGLALAGTPRLLIADEPTTALDVTVQAEILELLRQLVITRDMSIVIVTHDFGVVADICDDVSVMFQGRIVESGSVRDVLLNPTDEYTQTLLASGAMTAAMPADAAPGREAANTEEADDDVIDDSALSR